MRGAVSVERGERVLNGLGNDAALLAGDKVRTHSAGAARFEFIDGGRLALGGDTRCEVRSYQFQRPDDVVEAELDLGLGAVVLFPSAAAGPQDAIDLSIDDISVHVRAAGIAVVRLEKAFDFLVLLPGGAEGPHGEILLSTRICVRTLSEPWQCLRVSLETGDVSAKMAMPSPVVAEVFRATGLLNEIESAAVDAVQLIAPHNGAFDTGAASFEPFHELSDRLFERRFVPGQLYPDEHNANPDASNDLLEDAFDGKRFRVNPKENRDQE